uniref:Uncharacterized protein n=1 Tax=Trichogramma kaykai TaxID=54128 RepID=A0ABD2W7X6_9HYME
MFRFPKSSALFHTYMYRWAKQIITKLIYCGADDTLDDFVYLDDPKRRAEASYVYTHYDSSLRTHRNSQLYLAVILAWTMIVSTAPLQLVAICTSHMWR